MFKNLLKYPINYLFIIIIFYSVYDYFEHIGRQGSTFEVHPWYWLLFTVSAVLSLILVVALLKSLLQKISGKKNLLFEVIAIAVWIALYISIIGPTIDFLFWPFGDLHFRFNFGPVINIPGAYFIIRIVINLLTRKKILHSY